MEVIQEGRVRIDGEGDIVAVRKVIRRITMEVGFALTDVTRIVTAASELTRNIYRYAGSGFVDWVILASNSNKGIELVFTDYGPGIEDINKAMEPGFTTSNGMGLGLPGAKRLMDDMDIRSEPGKGTTVSVKKWLKN
jgi:serine/threonine-protein kinase RsbT